MMFLLSIHERYVERLLSGEKLFEYRKRIPVGLKRGDSLAIYCTKPTCSIVAYAEIGGVLEDSPTRLWDRTRYAAGIDEQAFMNYFQGKHKAYGIIISKVYSLLNSISMVSLRGKDFAPQSFIYLTDKQAKTVMSRAVQAKERGVSLFVGGVHGVGKTTICKVALAPLGFDCISASELIRRHVTMHITDKRVRNVSRNQEVLISESNKEKIKTLLYGLDGHYCLLNKRGNVERLPVEVFERLGIDLFVLIDSAVEEVVEHLKARDGATWTRSKASALMRAERTHAKRVAKKLGKSLVIIDARNGNGLNEIVPTLSELLSVRRTSSPYDDPKLK